MDYCCCLEALFFPKPRYYRETVHGARTGQRLWIYSVKGLSWAKRAIARIKQWHDRIEEPKGEGYTIFGGSFEELKLSSESLTSIAHWQHHLCWQRAKFDQEMDMMIFYVEDKLSTWTWSSLVFENATAFSPGDIDYKCQQAKRLIQYIEFVWILLTKMATSSVNNC